MLGRLIILKYVVPAEIGRCRTKRLGLEATKTMLLPPFCCLCAASLTEFAKVQENDPTSALEDFVCHACLRP